MPDMQRITSANMWYKLWKYCASQCFSFLTDGAVVYGWENFRKGAHIIISNHPSATDYFLAAHLFPGQFSCMMDKELFRLPLVNWIHAAAGHIPVGHGSFHKSIALARKKLSEGLSIVMPIEGRITPGSSFARPRMGAALLAMKAQVPILPCGIYVPPSSIKTIHFRLFGRDRVGKIQFGGHSIVQVGETWMPPPLPEENWDWEMLHKTAEQLLTIVRDLTRQAEEAYLGNFMTSQINSETVME